MAEPLNQRDLTEALDGLPFGGIRVILQPELPIATMVVSQDIWDSLKEVIAAKESKRA